MKKSKLLALAISAISTGILVSCAKPADNVDADKDKANAEPTDKTKHQTTDGSATTDSQKTEASEATTTNATAPAVEAIELPAEKTTAYLQHVSKDIITPLYVDASKQSQLLNEQAIEMCQAGTLSTEQVTKLRNQWLVVAESWAKAEAVNYGPAYDNMAHLYINYFPDERGLINKSVSSLIKDNPTLKPEQLVDESAIVQGVPALEDILYTNDALDKAQCNYLISASHELNRRFTDIATAWKQDGNTLLDTANPVMGMNQFFNGLLFHIENLKSTGIDKPLALNSKKKGHVPAHVAGQSRAIVNVKLDILNQALTDGELIDLIGDSDDGKKILEQMTTTIADSQKQLATMPEDISKASKKEQTKLYDNLTTLTKQIKRGIMPLLGVQLGFNSTDGD